MIFMLICLSAYAKFTFIIRVACVTVQFAGTHTHVGTARAIAQRRRADAATETADVIEE